jgi:hypothetical protein
MYYTIYKTTNMITGKKYIGKHVTEDIYDDYMGSGIILINAIKKYGKENFTKEILFVFDNEVQMNEKEKELITEDVVNDDDYYNIAYGGQGGNIVFHKNHPLYESSRKKLSDSQKSRSIHMSQITKENHKTKKVGMYGKSQSEYQKQKVSEVMKGKPKKEESIEKQRKSLLETLNSPDYIHPNKNKKRTDEMIEKMREISKNRPLKKCPNCSKEMDERNYARYHGDNCKMKKGEQTWDFHYHKDH